MRPSPQKSGSAAAFLLYALPVGPAFFLMTPIIAVLPGIYAKHFGINLATISTAMIVARVCDAIVDPIIGHWSDRIRAIYGSRLPMILTGGLLLVVGAYCLFSPPVRVSGVYLLFWTMVCYLGWTLFDIPHSAWAAEITSDYQARSRIYGFRSALTSLGAIAFFVLPLMPIFATSEYTLVTLQTGVYVGAAWMAIGLALATFAPRGSFVASPQRDSWRQLVRSIACNGPLLIFMAAFLCAGLGIGMWSGLLFLYVNDYLQLGQRLAVVFLVGTIIALAAIPIWLAIVKRLGKRLTWAAGIGLSVASIASFALVPPGASGFPLLLAACIGMNFSAVCQGVVGPSMLADIVDYGAWKFGRDRTATYFAFLAMVTKANAGIGAAAGLALAAVLGFDPARGRPDADALQGLQIAFVLGPALCLAGSLWFILKAPITEARHRAIMWSLARRSRRSNAQPMPAE